MARSSVGNSFFPHGKLFRCVDRLELAVVEGWKGPNWPLLEPLFEFRVCVLAFVGFCLLDDARTWT